MSGLKPHRGFESPPLRQSHFTPIKSRVPSVSAGFEGSKLCVNSVQKVGIRHDRSRVFNPVKTVSSLACLRPFSRRYDTPGRGKPRQRSTRGPAGDGKPPVNCRGLRGMAWKLRTRNGRLPSGQSHGRQGQCSTSPPQSREPSRAVVRSLRPLSGPDGQSLLRFPVGA